LIPSSLDSDRHLAPGRDLAGVAAVRLVFRQRTENSTAVREVFPYRIRPSTGKSTPQFCASSFPAPGESRPVSTLEARKTLPPRRARSMAADPAVADGPEEIPRLSGSDGSSTVPACRPALETRNSRWRLCGIKVELTLSASCCRSRMHLQCGRWKEFCTPRRIRYRVRDIGWSCYTDSEYPEVMNAVKWEQTFATASISIVRTAVSM
jgi:hypothetical protein